MTRASRRPRFAPISFFAAGAALSVVPAAFAETPAPATVPSAAPAIPAKTRPLSLRKVGQVQAAAPVQAPPQATPQNPVRLAAQTTAQPVAQNPVQTPAQAPQNPQTLPQIVTPSQPPAGQPNGPGSVNDVPQPSGKTPPTPFPKGVPSTDKTGVTTDTIKPTTVFNDNNAIPPGQPLPTDPNAIRTLDAALEIAFNRNPNVLIAQERALRTTHTVDQILALKKPQISASGTYTRLLNSSSNAGAASGGGLSPAQVTNPFQVGLTATPPGATPISLSGNSQTGSVGGITSGTVGQLGAANTGTTTTATPTRAVLPGETSETRQTTGTGGSGSGGTGTTTPGGSTGGGNTSGGGTTTGTTTNNNFGTLNRLSNLNAASARVTVAQLIDLTGIVRTAEQIGQLEEALTRLELARTRQETALQVKNGYYSVLRAQAFVGVNEAAVSQSAELLRVTTAQRDAGVASQFDVLRAQTQLDNNRQALISSRNQVAIAKNAFANTLGIDPSTPVTPEIPTVPPPPALDEEALIQTAISQRPEYLQADINVVKAQKNIKLAHRNLEPFANVVAGGVYDGTSRFLQQRGSAALGVTLTVPLYDGGATRASQEAARTDERGALIQKDQFVRGIKAEVQQSVIAVGDARDRSVSVAATVTQAQEALRLANVRFRAGVGTQLDVNDAQVALTQAQTNQVNAQYDYLGALARLSRAVGNPE